MTLFNWLLGRKKSAKAESRLSRAAWKSRFHGFAEWWEPAGGAQS